MLKIRTIIAKMFWLLGHTIALLGCFVEGKHIKQDEIKLSKHYCLMCAKDIKGRWRIKE